MAGTLTYEDNKPNSKASIGSVVISWTGTAGGAVSGITVPFNGRIELLQIHIYAPTIL